MDINIVHILFHIFVVMEIYVFLYTTNNKLKQNGENTECSHVEESIDSSTFNQNIPNLPISKSKLDSQAEKLLVDLKNELNEEVFLEDSEVYIDDYIDDYIDEPTGFEYFASAKIADQVDGPQRWVASIIGIEGTYIHINDGKRLWVQVGDITKTLSLGDVLILDVIREGRNISVKNIDRLETGVSEEYIIPDEEYIRNNKVAI